MNAGSHPNAHRAFKDWSEEQALHVAVAYSNPFRWRTRRYLLNDFRLHMQSSANVVLHVGELAYGNRPFEVTSQDNPLDVQFRTSQELWHKENLLNLIVQRFPADWKYGAILDGDFTMTRHDWALEAVHQLQHHDFVQLYSSLAYLSGEHRPHRMISAFAYNWLHGGGKCRADYSAPGAVGGGWAFRRSAFDTVGGMLDVCILGSADWHMAFGLIGESSSRSELRNTPPAYAHAVRCWQQRAKALNRNIGFVENHAIHHFHGALQNRGYGTRTSILINNQFDPTEDICRDWQGVLRLNGNKPKLRDEIRAYFRSRCEDSTEMKERHLV